VPASLTIGAAQLNTEKRFQFSKCLWAVDNPGRIPFPNDCAVPADEPGRWPSLNTISGVIAVALVPKNAMLCSPFGDSFQNLIQWLKPAAVDLDDDQTIVCELVVPPDQVVAQRRAVLSEIELQPDWSTLQFFQGQRVISVDPVSCLTHYLRWLTTEERRKASLLA